MIKNFFVNAARNLQKHGGYFAINITGLAIGLISFIFISLYVMNELSYDKFHSNYRNIYRVKIIGRMAGGELDQAITAAPMAQAILKDYPEVLKAARVRGMGDWLIGFGDKKFNEEGVLFADSNFFDVLDFVMVKGDPQTALVRPRSMVLTEEYSEKYFGDQDPIGQRLTVESDTVLYTVTGIIRDVPDNSHIKFDILASMSTYPGMANNQFWVSHSFYTYLVVRDDADIKALQDKFQEMVINYVGPQLKEIMGQTIDDFRKAGNDFSYIPEPLKDIHLKGATQYNLEPPGSPATVIIFAAIAILILLVVIINYINLATAKSMARAKEVGIRKVSGAGKTGLLIQFLAESLIIVSIAALLALLIVYILTPSFNQVIGKHLSLGSVNNFMGISILVALVVFVGTASGFYPAFVLASFNPSTVLKGTMNPGSMSKRLRGILVVFQFTVSIIIIIGSIIVSRQLNFLTRKDLGFDKENLIILRRADAFWQQLESFRAQVLEIPGVEKAGFSRSVPGTNFNNNAFFKDDDPEKNTYLINQAQVSFSFPEALGVQLAEGRYFSKEFGTDSTAILINESAVRFLGLKDPLSQFLLQPGGPQEWIRYKVIGVMKDFNIESMHKEIGPVCFTVNRGGGGDQYAAIRLSGSNVEGTISEIEQLWKTFTPDMPFQHEFFADKWDNLYSSEMKTGKIFLIFSLLAIFIACVGLIGLVTYITSKRTREIGIRKSYGASTPVILALLSREMFSIILFSSLFAYPVAWFGSVYWLEGFASRIPVSPLFFILASIITLIIGWLSIISQTIKAASYNPAAALRTE